MKKENFVKPSFFWTMAFIVSMLLFPTTLLNAQTSCTTVTFAQFTQKFGGQDFIFSNRGSFASFDTISSGTPVDFTYLNIAGLPAELQGDQDARVFFNCVTNQPSVQGGGNTTQPFTGTCTIQIIRDTPASFGRGSRTNLLSVTIDNFFAPPSRTLSDLTGTSGGNSAGFSASQPGGQAITFTSDFLDFSLTEGRNLSLSFSSINPIFSQGPGGFLNSFSAAGAGSFASCPVPVLPPTAASATIGGRVFTPYGRGLSKARVTLTNSSGETFTTMTNSFGYYRFTDVDSGQPVVITVSSKRYEYAPKVLNVGEDLYELDFIPE